MTRLQLHRTQQDGKVSFEVEETSQVRTWAADEPLHIVGQPHPRLEGADKVTGRAMYASDQHLSRQLYARVLRSPHPHARIRRIDTSRAEALPGVHAVLSSTNCGDVRWYQEQALLFDPHLRFVGDEVAAVAATNGDIAEDALRLIDVEYESLPFIADLEGALRPEAPLIHSHGRYANEPEHYTRGDVESAFARAEVVVEQEYMTQTALHNCLEAHGCTATWDGERLTLWESTQAIWDVRRGIADALHLPHHHVRVIKQYMGGGFGSKQVAWKPTAIAALLARQAGRPVQLLHDRESENLAAGNRSPTRQKVRLAARRDGTLVGIDVRIDLAQGAYVAGGEVAMVDGIYQSLYRCPNVRTARYAYYTNTGPAVAFRAPGFVEGAFGLECAMDELARQLGLDPVELRRRNYTTQDQSEGKPYTSPDSLRECMTRVTETFGWRPRDESAAPQGRSAALPHVGDSAAPQGGLGVLPHENNGQAGGTTFAKRKGVGFAVHNWIGGAGHPPGYAWIKLNSDGTADVVTGTQDIGTGSRTGLTQIAAEELGLTFQQVRLHLGDTAYGPYAPVSSGSATQATIGPAIQAAAADVRSQVLQAAAKMLECQPADLSVRDGDIYLQGVGKRCSVAEVAAQVGPHMIQAEGVRGPNPKDKAVRTFGAQCVEVEVDVETGEVSVLRVVASHDCGRIVNPTMVESQVIGAVAQGIGFGLLEERVVDARTGVVLNPNLEFYEVPSVADVPRIEHAPHGVPDVEANSTGAKGVGEPPLIPTAPAIANAIFDATGVRVRETPITRKRLLEALHARV